MRRTWLPLVAAALMFGMALLVASPFGDRFATSWLPAFDFALGVALVTLAFLEIARAVVGWFTRAGSMRWVIGGLITGGGLFTAGASSMVHSRALAFDWLALFGVAITIAGVQLQHRARGAAKA